MVPQQNDKHTNSHFLFFFTFSKQKRRARYRRRRRLRDRRRREAENMVVLSEEPDVQPNLSSQPEICTFHVKGNCKHGDDDCVNLHRPSKLPYQWQWKKGDEWKYFNDSRNRKIEQAFCNPASDKIGKINKVG